MNKNKLGSLWKRKSKDGTKTFLTGRVGNHEVIIFANNRKQEGTKQPDFEVYESEPREKPVQKNEENPFDVQSSIMTELLSRFIQLQRSFIISARRIPLSSANEIKSLKFP